MKHEYRRRGLMTHGCQPQASNLRQQLNIGGGFETRVACTTKVEMRDTMLIPEFMESSHS